MAEKQPKRRQSEEQRLRKELLDQVHLKLCSNSILAPESKDIEAMKIERNKYCTRVFFLEFV
ncbi:hypothetical protein AOLI_G00260080 [Acnodon oligacanthus]